MTGDRLPVSQGRPGDEIVPNLPRTENKKYYPALDGLRAIAVLLVFFHHYEGTAHPTLYWGWVGVDLFFVLSGFLITGILYDTRDAAHRFREFYIRRTLRIFPLYYGVLLTALLLTPVLHFHWHPAWLLWAMYLGNYVRFLYLHDPSVSISVLEHLRTMPPWPSHYFFFGHFWSLCVEEQFYLIWPLVVFSVRNRERLRNLSLAICALVLAARIVCVFTVPEPYLTAQLLYRLTPLRADALLIGGLVALTLRGAEGHLVRRWATPALLAFVTGFFVWESLYRLLGPTHRFYEPTSGAPVLTTVGYTLIDLFAAVLIVKLIEPGSVPFRMLNRSALRWLGQISYGFYVFHDIFHSIYGYAAQRIISDRHPVGRRLLMDLLGLVGTTILAYVSFRFYEAPFLRWKDRLTSSRHSPRSQVVPAGVGGHS